MAAHSKGRRSKRADLIFAVEDPYRNIVRLERNTWESHIRLRHDDLPDDVTGDAIKRLIAEPDRIRESTTDVDVGMFEDDTIRASVLYEDVDFIKGETFGRVTTVYLIDPSKRSNVGRVLWVNPRFRGTTL